MAVFKEHYSVMRGTPLITQNVSCLSLFYDCYIDNIIMAKWAIIVIIRLLCLENVSCKDIDI